MIIKALLPGGVAITLGDPPHPSVRTYRIYEINGEIMIPDDEAELFRNRVDGAVAAGLIEIVQDTAQARLGTVSTLPQFFCTVTEQPGNLVCVSAANTVTRALASDSSKIDVVGHIVSKPASNLCVVSSDPGTVTSSGLTVGARVYLSPTTPGAGTTTIPIAPNAVVEVGVAVSTTAYFFTGAKIIV